MDGIKLAKLALKALESNMAPLDRPYKLTFAVTYRCQSRCTNCNIWKEQPKGELSIGEIGEFAKKNGSFKWITFTGGEPFMRGDIVEVIKAFYESCKGLYIITMPTNALCSTDMMAGKIERMLDLGIPRLALTLSLDGFRELNDKIRGVPGDFDRVIALAKRLREVQKKHDNVSFVFGYTMVRSNLGMLKKTYEGVKKELPDATYDDFHINLGQNSELYYRNAGIAESDSEKNMMAKELEWLLEKRSLPLGAMSLLETTFIRKLIEFVRTGKSPMKSVSLDASLFLDSYGNVFPSIAWNRKIGNLRDCGYDISKIWHNKEAEDVRKLIKEGKEPDVWTACEAYQALAGNVGSLIGL